jgi:type VI secretion system protein ImpC
VLDASFDELAADSSALAPVLDACAPSVLLVDEVLSDHLDSLLALSRLLDVCKGRDVLLLAGAHAHLAGCAHFEELSQPDENEHPLSADVRAALQELLGQRERGARFALALPRFLLRQPYGAEGEPIEHFPFEEVLAPSDHEAFPWGNGAYLVARALAQRRVHEERAVFPDGSIDVRELPVVYLASEGDSRIKPAAEAWLSERALGGLRAAGFAVLQGMRDSDRVRVHL